MNRSNLVSSTAVLALASLAYGTGTPNYPPSPAGFPSGNIATLDACIDQVLSLSPQFNSPEYYQTTTVTYTDAGGAVGRGLAIDITNGNVATIRMNWAPTWEDAGSYVIRFTARDSYGAQTSVSLTINVNCSCQPPAAAAPRDVSVCPGEDAVFFVTPTGADPIEIQWQKDNVDIPGATDAYLVIAGATERDAGYYRVTMNNCDDRRMTTPAALLTIDSLPIVAEGPSDLTLCPGEPATFSVSASGTEPFDYQWQKDGADIVGATGSTFTIPAVQSTDAGRYSVNVGNVCGNDISAAADLSVLSLPQIDEQPVTQNVCAGGSVTFSTEASGSDPLSYQWYVESNQIPGANEDTLVIDNVSVDDAGKYRVIVTNACGQVVSRIASLIVDTVPAIETQPQPHTTCPGDPVTFTVGASHAGNAAMSYQWRKNGTNIAGANGTSYTIPLPVAADAGNYSVVVSNVCGQVASIDAPLTVLVDPAVTQQPASRSACTGEMVTFTVAHVGTAPIAYQWQKNGLNIAGATGNSLTIGPVTAADAGIYRVRIANSCSAIFSQNAALLINVGPSITRDPVDQSVCRDADVTFNVEATGTERLYFQWKKNGVNIAGATGPTLVLHNVTGADAGLYHASVENACGIVDSRPARLAFDAGNFEITRQPTSVDVCTGDPLSLTIAAVGSPTPQFQWRKDGVSIVGQTGSVFTIASTVETDSGTYDVEVSNGCGSIISDAAAVLVWPKGSADTNGDGAVNGADIRYFLEELFSIPVGGGAPTLSKCGSDMNGNGTVGIEDVPGFINRLLGQ